MAPSPHEKNASVELKAVLAAATGSTLVGTVPMLALAPACTDLTEVPSDALTPDNAFRTQTEILAGVASFLVFTMRL